jgi:hypothetical protein
MTETDSLLVDLTNLNTFSFLNLDKDTQESKNKKIQDILLANKVNTLAILGEASWIASNNFELPDDFYRFYTNIPLDSETEDSIFQKHERAKKMDEQVSQEYYEVRLKQDTVVGWFRQATKQMMKILNFSHSSFQNLSKSFEFSWDDANKQIKFIEKNDKKEIVNKGIVICLTESMTNNVKLGARLQYLWDNVASVESPVYELARQELRNYLKSNYPKEVYDISSTILKAKNEVYATIKFDDLKTLVKILDVDVTPPANRSSNTSIDEKLDALINIQSELISLLKKKLL